jgi:hypothetical protein
VVQVISHPNNRVKQELYTHKFVRLGYLKFTLADRRSFGFVSVVTFFRFRSRARPSMKSGFPPNPLRILHTNDQCGDHDQA